VFAVVIVTYNHT